MLELKRHKTEFKADVAKRRVEAYASTFGNIDGNDDVALKGAYLDTLKTDLPARQIKVKRNHQVIIGKPEHAEEDSTGLLTVSTISQTDLGNETLILIQDEALDEMSIGFKALDKDFAVRDGRRVRELKRVKLYEWSFMDDVPANAQARVIGYKSLEDIMCVFDQMQSALWSLRNLARTPPDVLERLGQLMTDIDSLTASAEASDEQAQIAGLSATLADLQSYLTSSRST